MTTKGERARVLALCVLATAFVSTASLVGIGTDDGGDPYRVTSARGQAVDIYGGQGLYRHDSVAKAIAFRGFDWVSLIICVPLSVLGAFLYRGGRLRGQLILAAVFTYFAYIYLIGVVGNAFNDMFLVWTAVFSTGAFGLALVLAGIDVPGLPAKLGVAFPRRGLAAYMMVLAVALLGQYLAQVVAAHAARRPPTPLEVYTTLELAALELGIMVPLHIVGAVLLWRRNAWGYLIAIPLAFAAAMTFIALSVGQVLLYVSFGRGSAADLVQPIVFAGVASGLSFVTLQRVKA